MSADIVLQALAARTGFEAVQVSGDATFLRLMGRVPQPRTPDMMAMFKVVLNVMRGETWVMDPSKYYFVPDGMEDPRYAWRLIFETKDASVPLPMERIAAAILKAPSMVHSTGGASLENMEIKLAGASSLRRGVNNAGKGAAPMGKAMVGPMRRG
jgi:hypothetical protein